MHQTLQMKNSDEPEWQSWKMDVQGNRGSVNYLLSSLFLGGLTQHQSLLYAF